MKIPIEQLGAPFVMSVTVEWDDPAGTGTANTLQLPTNIPAGTVNYEIESLILFVYDVNLVPSHSEPFPMEQFGPTVGGNFPCVFIVPQAAPANPTFQNLEVSSNSPWPLNFLGPAIPLRLTLSQGVGPVSAQVDIWMLDTPQRVFIPQGYCLRIFVMSPNDGSPHVGSATVFAQARTLDCEC